MGSYEWVTSPLILVMIMATLLITPLITTHEPPSTLAQSPHACSEGLRDPCWAGAPGGGIEHRGILQHPMQTREICVKPS